MKSRRIALDVMGGDNAPQAMLRGALRASALDHPTPVPAKRILLVGDEEVIEDGLAEEGGNPGFAIQHASQVVAMHEAPAIALRRKPDSSIARAVLAVREKEAGAVVSMGNTGALVACATRGLGTLPGVKRPGIAVTISFRNQHLTLLDMGANIAPKPEHLLQYAQMGSTYARDILGCENARVGLLNIGEEESKGTRLLKDSYALLSSSARNFVGNIEGDKLFAGEVDVVVTDGFTGNVVLKLLEGFSKFMLRLVLGELKSHGVDWAPDVLANVKQNIDYAEYGGALLLGVAGAVVVGHGRSDDVAVANALVLASNYLDAGVNEGIVQRVAGAPCERTEQERTAR
jgi:phosphate acyltransferase